MTISAAASAAVIGTDNTSASPYDDGWQYGDDGAVTGDAFGSWRLFTTVTSPGFAGHFQQDSRTLSGATDGADINAAGKAWSMFAGGGDGGSGQADAFRDFNGGALSIGQSFSISLAVNFRNGYKGIDVRDLDNGGNTIFNFNVGDDDYTVNSAATGNGSIGNSYGDTTAFAITLTQTSATGGTWQVERSGDVTDIDTGTYTGKASGIKLYIGQTSGGDANNLFANSMSIVPEPTAIMTTAGAMGILLVRRRSKGRIK